jgi:hypothetical protein
MATWGSGTWGTGVWGGGPPKPTIEAAITQRLRGNADITKYVSLFNGSPAIFSDIAPQQAILPYVVFDTQNSNDSNTNLGVNSFIIDVDIYGDRNSHANIRAMAQEIIFSLDRAVLNCDIYKTIRIYFESEGHVENSDIKITHYNMQFSARASRYAWMQKITR